MSWNEYIDRIICACDQHADGVCIIALDGGMKWTSNDHPQALDLTPAEAKKIAEDMKDDDHSAMHCSGVRLNSCKYQCVKAEGNSAFFRKKEMGGIAIHRTKKAVIIAHIPEGKQPGNVSKGVGIMADYLESTGM